MSNTEHTSQHIVLIKRVVIPLLFFIWGVGASRFDLFPHSLINEAVTDLDLWLRGNVEGQQLNFGQKLKASLVDPELHLSGESKIDEKFKLTLETVRDPQGLLKESPRELLYYSVFAKGYYLLFYIPHLPDAYFGALVISGDGEVKKLIKVPKNQKGRQILGQGGVTDDGHIIFNSYLSLLVTNICGDRLLEVPTEEGRPFSQGDGVGFHHKASGDGSLIWTWYGNSLRQYDLRSKTLIREISLLELVAANPERPVFEARLIKSNLRGTVGQWKYSDLKNGLKLEQISLHDPFHQNDVDVLPQAKAQLFPNFVPGDLLLSFRSLNLIVVIDPNTLKIKWHHFGDFSRQHDPDWGPNGEIIVYDNRSHQMASRIISINPVTHKVTTLIDGEEWGFYQFAQGNQHMSADGRILFTNNSEVAHATNDRLDFYFKYKNNRGSALDIGTAYHITEEQYLEWTRKCGQ